MASDFRTSPPASPSPAKSPLDASAPTEAWGYGLATIANNGTVLDTWFPNPQVGAFPGSTVSSDAAPSDSTVSIPSVLENFPSEDPRRNVRCEIVTVTSDLTSPPQSTEDAYLRLHLLSHLLVAPNTINLDGIFGVLPIVMWTNAGPMHPHDFDRLRPTLLHAGIYATSIDKFPPLLNYVTPSQVRIGDASRVRLGAHLAPGTTVMHEGFVNFNAGTLGTSMVEGRVSQGVVVGAGSDIGGGASIMGTLSGGGTERISIGERALLGANAGIGISIGDDSVVEAGLYLTAGTKITLIDTLTKHRIVKAAELSGTPNLLFRRNSVTGAVEALQRSAPGVYLNAQLHT